MLASDVLPAENAAAPPASTSTSVGTNVDATIAASTVRRGVIRLGRRLRLERPAHDVPLLQLAVLADLNEGGPLTPGQLAATQRVQPQSLTRVLASLEASGLTARQPDPGDGRRALLVITEAGRDVLRRDVGQRDRWLARAMAAQLTPTEQELLRLAGELMDRLAEAGPPSEAEPSAVA